MEYGVFINKKNRVKRLEGITERIISFLLPKR